MTVVSNERFCPGRVALSRPADQRHQQTFISLMERYGKRLDTSYTLRDKLALVNHLKQMLAC